MPIKHLLTAVILFTVYGTCHAGSCLTETCKIGDTVKTHTSKNDVTYFCPTQALTEYTSFILGMWAVQSEIMGIQPDRGIESNSTGETAVMLSNLRRAAKVNSYDEAANLCTWGKNGVKGSIIDKPAGSVSMKIQPKGGLPAFWTTEGFVIKSKSSK